jgi:hypothetical protein
MSTGIIFFDIVVDQVPVRSRQVIPHLRQRPQNVGKDLHFQREIEQVVLQTILAETVGAILRIRIDSSLGWVAVVGDIEPLRDLGMRKSN